MDLITHPQVQTIEVGPETRLMDWWRFKLAGAGSTRTKPAREPGAYYLRMRCLPDPLNRRCAPNGRPYLRPLIRPGRHSGTVPDLPPAILRKRLRRLRRAIRRGRKAQISERLAALNFAPALDVTAAIETARVEARR